MLNRSAEYALKATLRLAHGPPTGHSTSDELAEALDLPSNFLSKLLNRLRQEGVLESRRGPQGGFRLAREPGQVTLADVVGPFDDVVRDRQCLLGRAECRDASPCAAHERWKGLAKEIESFFRETTLADLGPRPPDEGIPGSGGTIGVSRSPRADDEVEGEEPA